MKSQHITPAMIELRAAITEVEQLSAKPELSKRDEARINVQLAKIAVLRSSAIAPDDTAKRWFTAFLRGETVPETRADLLAGTRTPTYTQGAAGGFIVPIEFHNELILGLSQNDPFLDENVVTLIRSNSFSLRPYTLPGWDLSAYAAVKVAEGVQQNPQVPPAATGTILNGYTYRATLDASFEFEEDEFETTVNMLRTGYEQAFARGIGADLATGDGTTAPQGVLTGAHDSGVTTGAANVLVDTDFDAIYFSVDRVYREAPKCAWAFNDTTYQRVRKAHDSSGRPLINVIGDKEVLLGKPILISPTLSDVAGQRGIVFGDFSHYVVRTSRMVLSRNLQTPGYVEKGKGLYTARMRADAKVIDPTGGSKAPLVFATLHT